jgi:hypothetical protein
MEEHMSERQIIEIEQAEYDRLLAIAADYGPSKTIAGFCEAENMSKAMFHKMMGEGWGPEVYYVGEITLIAPAAHREWRKQRAMAATFGVKRGLPDKTA